MKTYVLGLFLFLSCGLLYAQSANNINDWERIEDNTSINKSSELKTPSVFELFRLNDYQELFDRLINAPGRYDQVDTEQIFMNLPVGNSELEQFKVLNAPVMDPSLVSKFPEIKNYTLIGIDKAYIRAKIDFGPKGFHAMVLDPTSGAIFIEPYNLEENVYMVFHKEHYPVPKQQFLCSTPQENTSNRIEKSMAGDCQFREYRLALACTGEYATFHGGTVPLALAAMNVTMNRVNGIYEQDAGITMILVPNNNLLVFLNASTDPYTNSNGSAMLSQNQTTCDNIIGSANYDIGHVFSTGGGGVAYLNAPCNNSIKAGGVSGQGSPIGDPFDVDYVAHEIGHQFGASHTQNNSCNRSSAHAYEPGSASTIMGYAGICPPNVQSNSDPYFHATSISSFAGFVTNPSTGGSCDNILSTSNNPPTADAGMNYTIPISTAFKLTGIASDPDGDPVTYCWEQYDNQVSSQPPIPTSTVGPNFRTLLPKTSPIREFPENGIPNAWEVLPSVARTMNFKLTVRDYNSTYSYGCTDEDDMQVTTITTAGPFSITSPNGGETWDPGSTATVQWNVANTDIAPINCSNVDIMLSLDGGLNYDIMLASNVPNDGSHDVDVPYEVSTSARIKIRSIGHIFFDVSNNNFDIGSVPSSCISYTSTDVPVSIPTTVATVYSDLNISNTDDILDVRVTNLVGTHTWISDLQFSLISPSGTEVLLLGAECGQQDDFDMEFYDGAAGITCPLDQGLTYNPEQPLSAFSGESANGLWRLKIADTANQDGGQLTSWGLEICYTVDCTEAYNFNAGIIASGNYFGSQTIDASVPAADNSNVWLRAPDIDLEPGFEVPSGATMFIDNRDCPY